VVALDETFPVREAVRVLLAFNMRESCGKCTPCREGTVRLLEMLDGALDEHRVKELAEAVQLASLCGLGQAAPLSLLSGLAAFPAAFGVS
jgi:NADH:ubiquinone oxidoreductase subunit F (NADH-binding)